MPPAAHSGSSTALGGGVEEEQAEAGRVGRGLDGGAAAEPLELHQQVGRLREGEELLHGIEGHAADGPGEGLVPDDLPVGQPHDGMEHRAHARPGRSGARARRGAPPPRPRARPGSSSIASATACWMARSLRTMGSLWMRACPAERRRMRSTLAGGAGLDARRAAPASSRVAAARPLRRASPSGQEDEEAVGAHGVQADDVLGGRARRPRAATRARPRTRAPRRRRRPSRAWSRGRPSGRGRGRRRPPRPSTPGCGARPPPPRAGRAGR